MSLARLAAAGMLACCLAGCGSQTKAQTQSVAAAPPQPLVTRTVTNAVSSSSSVVVVHHQLRHCDPNVEANSVTSCPFAENVFRAYAHAYGPAAADVSVITVFSPVTGRSYVLNCHENAGVAACVGGNNAGVRFPLRAVTVYESAAGDDAAGPGANQQTQTDQQQTSATQATTQAPASAEGPGSSSHTDDAAFCAAHTCIGAFETEGGYIVECSDGTFSHAGGISGACSDHGGEQ